MAANHDALALIVGVADYENTPAKAIFADSDALMFRDYASEKLGIPENRIKTLVDDGADERQLLLSVKNWLSRAMRQNQSDVYVFFAITASLLTMVRRCIFFLTMGLRTFGRHCCFRDRLSPTLPQTHVLCVLGHLLPAPPAAQTC